MNQLPLPNDNTIMSKQMQAITTLISTMTIASGYYFDWLTINNRNYAIGTFPRAEVYVASEENLDQLSGIGSQDYTNAVNYEIVVTGKLTFSSVNPFFDIISVHNMALEDLKKLFGSTNPINRSLNDTCDSCLYKGMKPERKAIDQFTPTKIVVTLRVVYSQDRSDPSRYAGS
jgi:hypothetical protein